MNRARRQALIAKLKTIGISDRVQRAISKMMYGLMDKINIEQNDEKRRHFVLLIYTNEDVNNDDGSYVVVSDCVSSLDKGTTEEFVADWLRHHKLQHRG